MPALNPTRTMNLMRKNTTTLSVILRGVDQAQAQASRDGAEGWSVLEIVCHLNDYEEIFMARNQAIVAEAMPTLATYDPPTLATERNYQGQDFKDVLSSWIARRKAHLEFLSALTPEQWERRGVHPTWGQPTINELIVVTSQHDGDHIEQIIRALGLSEAIL